MRQVHSSDKIPTCIRALTPDELHGAADILVRGMLDNPLHVRVFGNDINERRPRLARFLGQLVAYVHANGRVMGAYRQGELVGALGMIKPGHCRPGLADKVHFARAILHGTPPITLLRVQRWLAAWARNDPDAPHWHIGPLAVQPALRRQGIGRRLMTDCTAQLDTRKAMAWLETDLDINVAFYRSLGFVVVRQEPVLGVPTWFMRRLPDGGGDAAPAEQ